MPDPKYRLRVKRIETVGFVDKGDNPAADVVFWKRKPGMTKEAETYADQGNRDGIYSDIWRMTDRIGSALRAAIFEADDDQDPATLIETSLGQFVADVRAASPKWVAGEPVMMKESRMKKFWKALAEKVGMTGNEIEELLADEGAEAGSGDGSGAATEDTTMGFDVTKLDDAARAEFEKLTERAEAAEQKVVELTPPAAPEPLPESVQKQMDAMAKRVEAAEQRAQKLEDERENQRYIAKAQALGLPGTNPDDFGSTLRKIAGVLGEDFEKFEQTLSAAVAQADASQLYGEFGRGGAGSSSVSAEVAELAKAEMEKDPTLTLQGARGRVWKARPDLYNQYEAERAGFAKTQPSED